MTVLALGLSHDTAPLDIRGRFAFPRDRLAPALQGLRERLAPQAEVAIVSTCNRTELYLGAGGEQDPGRLADEALGWLAACGDMSQDAVRRHFYRLEDDGAVRHTFRLASGLASMVVGETQILGQMKDAVREADKAGTLGATLHQLFQRSFAIAKEVRTGTEVGMHAVSLGTAIVRIASRVFEDFGRLNVLFLGAGEMAAPVLAHVAARSPARLTVANRSIERGEAVALRFGADAMQLDAAMGRLADYDLVIACTASPVPVIGRPEVERALKARRNRPMLMVDLAVPRDIDAAVRMLPDVFLYSLDELSQVVREGGERRQAAVAEAESIIEDGVRQFLNWLGTRETVPLIHALNERAEAWRSAELARARKLLARGEDVEAVLEAMSRGLTQKMLHGPMAGLHASDPQDREQLTRTLSRLFLQCPVRERR